MNLNEQVSAAVIAEALDLKKSRINELVNNGVLHPIGGNPRKYVLREALHAYIGYLRGRIDPSRQEQAAIETARLKADTAYKMARANTAQLELQELEGKMHRSEDVQAAFEGFAYTVRSTLLAMPGRESVDLAQEGYITRDQAASVAKLLQKHTHEAMSELSEYHYDPDFYAQRVSEREGWTNNAADSSDED